MLIGALLIMKTSKTITKLQKIIKEQQKVIDNLKNNQYSKEEVAVDVNRFPQLWMSESINGLFIQYSPYEDCCDLNWDEIWDVRAFKSDFNLGKDPNVIMIESKLRHGYTFLGYIDGKD